MEANKEKEDALRVMIGALNLAQEKGAFTLDQASKVHQAIGHFVAKPEENTKEKSQSETTNMSA